MPHLTSSALLNDPEGLAFLRSVLKSPAGPCARSAQHDGRRVYGTSAGSAAPVDRAKVAHSELLPLVHNASHFRRET
jgi:hypothetical protein